MADRRRSPISRDRGCSLSGPPAPRFSESTSLDEHQSRYLSGNATYQAMRTALPDCQGTRISCDGVYPSLLTLHHESPDWRRLLSMDTLKSRFLVALVASSILVLAAGNINGSYSYLRLDGRITYPTMTPLGKLAADLRMPGSLAIRKFMDVRHSFIAAREHDQDLQERYSALILYAASVLISILVYTGLLYSFLTLARVTKRRLAEMGHAIGSHGVGGLGTAS
jgi:hypothetical protein